MNDLIINHIAELILPKSTDKPLKGKELDELNVVKNGTVVIKDGKIVYAGQHTDDYDATETIDCLLYTSPSPRDKRQSRMPSSA